MTVIPRGSDHLQGRQGRQRASRHLVIVSGVGGLGHRTRVSYETRPLAYVHEAIAEVLQGKAKARLVLEP